MKHLREFDDGVYQTKCRTAWGRKGRSGEQWGVGRGERWGEGTDPGPGSITRRVTVEYHKSLVFLSQSQWIVHIIEALSRHHALAST